MRTSLMIFVVLASLALVPGCGGDESPAHVERLPPVRISKVTQVIPEVGSRHLILLEPWRRAELSPRYGGQIAELLVDEQIEVKEGDLLVRFLDADASGSLMSARASRTSSEARLADLERQLADAKALLQLGAGTRREVERIETDIETTRAAIRQAAGQVIQSRDRKSANTITAPFPGVITKLDAELGEYAAPGTPLATLSQLDTLAVDVPLSEHEMVVHEGSGLEFEVRIRGEEVPATLEWIAREADAGTNTFPARLKIDNTQNRLRAGEAVEVRVHGETGKPVITVPPTAVRWEAAQAYILRSTTVGAGDEAREQLERIDVVVHEDVDGRVAIEGPLAVGDRVVSSGPATLVDGDVAIAVAQPSTGANQG